MRVVRRVAAVIAVLMFAAPGAASATSSTERAALTKSIHLAFEGCPAKEVTETVVMPRLTFAADQPVTFRLTLRNSGAVACEGLPASGPPQGPGSPSLHAITLGPCGTVSMVVDNSSGRDVYPGSGTYACPLELSARLPADASISTTGSWPQRGYGQTPTGAQVPRGRYRLVIGGHISFPIDLVAATGPMTHRAIILPDPATG